MDPLGSPPRPKEPSSSSPRNRDKKEQGSKTVPSPLDSQRSSSSSAIFPLKPPPASPRSSINLSPKVAAKAAEVLQKAAPPSPASRPVSLNLNRASLEISSPAVLHETFKEAFQTNDPTLIKNGIIALNLQVSWVQVDKKTCKISLIDSEKWVPDEHVGGILLLLKQAGFNFELEINTYFKKVQFSKVIGYLSPILDSLIKIAFHSDSRAPLNDDDLLSLHSTFPEVHAVFTGTSIDISYIAVVICTIDHHLTVVHQKLTRLGNAKLLSNSAQLNCLFELLGSNRQPIQTTLTALNEMNDDLLQFVINNPENIPLEYARMQFERYIRWLNRERNTLLHIQEDLQKLTLYPSAIPSDSSILTLLNGLAAHLENVCVKLHYPALTFEKDLQLLDGIIYPLTKKMTKLEIESLNIVEQRIHYLNYQCFDLKAVTFIRCNITDEACKALNLFDRLDQLTTLDCQMSPQGFVYLLSLAMRLKANFQVAIPKIVPKEPFRSETLDHVDLLKALYLLLNDEQKETWADSIIRGVKAEYIPIIIQDIPSHKRSEAIKSCMSWVNKVWNRLVEVNGKNILFFPSSSVNFSIIPASALSLVAIVKPLISHMENISVDIPKDASIPENSDNYKYLLSLFAPIIESITETGHRITKEHIDYLKRSCAKLAYLKFIACTFEEEACQSLVSFNQLQRLTTSLDCHFQGQGYIVLQALKTTIKKFEVAFPKDSMGALNVDQKLALLPNLPPEQAKKMAEDISEQLKDNSTLAQLEKFLRYANQTQQRQLIVDCTQAINKHKQLQGLINIDSDKKEGKITLLKMQLSAVSKETVNLLECVSGGISYTIEIHSDADKSPKDKVLQLFPLIQGSVIAAACEGTGWNLNALKERFGACPRLVRLHIKQAQELSDQDLIKLKAAIPSLKTITFDKCPKEVSYKGVAECQEKQLEVVCKPEKIGDCRELVTREQVECYIFLLERDKRQNEIEKAVKTIKPELLPAKHVKHKTPQQIALETIRTSYSHLITISDNFDDIRLNATSNQIPTLIHLMNTLLPQLRPFTLTVEFHSSEYTQEIEHFLLPLAPKLKELRETNNPQVTKKHVDFITTHLTQLKTLHFNNCAVDSDACTKLTTVPHIENVNVATSKVPLKTILELQDQQNTVLPNVQELIQRTNPEESLKLILTLPPEKTPKLMDFGFAVKGSRFTLQQLEQLLQHAYKVNNSPLCSSCIEAINFKLEGLVALDLKSKKCVLTLTNKDSPCWKQEENRKTVRSLIALICSSEKLKCTLITTPPFMQGHESSVKTFLEPFSKEIIEGQIQLSENQELEGKNLLSLLEPLSELENLECQAATTLDDIGLFSLTSQHKKLAKLAFGEQHFTFSSLVKFRSQHKTVTITHSALKELGNPLELDTVDQIRSLIAWLNQEEKEEWINNIFQWIKPELVSATLNYLIDLKGRSYLRNYSEWMNIAFGTYINIDGENINLFPNRYTPTTLSALTLKGHLNEFIAQKNMLFYVNIFARGFNSENELILSYLLKILVPKMKSLLEINNPNVTKEHIDLFALPNQPIQILIFNNCNLENLAACEALGQMKGLERFSTQSCVINGPGFIQLFKLREINNFEVPLPSEAFPLLNGEDFLYLFNHLPQKEHAVLMNYLAEHFEEKSALFKVGQLIALLSIANQVENELLIRNIVAALNKHYKGLLAIDLEQAHCDLSFENPSLACWKQEESRIAFRNLLLFLKNNTYTFSILLSDDFEKHEQEKLRPIFSITDRAIHALNFSGSAWSPVKLTENIKIINVSRATLTNCSSLTTKSLLNFIAMAPLSLDYDLDKAANPHFEELNAEEAKKLFAWFKKKEKTEWIIRALNGIKPQFIPDLLEHIPEDKKAFYLQRFKTWLNASGSPIILDDNFELILYPKTYSASQALPFSMVASSLKALSPHLKLVRVFIGAAAFNVEHQKDVRNWLKGISPKACVLQDTRVTPDVVGMLKGLEIQELRMEHCTVEAGPQLAELNLTALHVDVEGKLSAENYMKLLPLRASIKNFDVPLPKEAFTLLTPQDYLTLLTTATDEQKEYILKGLVEHVSKGTLANLLKIDPGTGEGEITLTDPELSKHNQKVLTDLIAILKKKIKFVTLSINQAGMKDFLAALQADIKNLHCQGSLWTLDLFKEHFNGFSNLESLDFNQCGQLNDQSLLELVRPLRPKIQRLSICQCPEISLGGVAQCRKLGITIHSDNREKLGDISALTHEEILQLLESKAPQQRKERADDLAEQFDKKKPPFNLAQLAVLLRLGHEAKSSLSIKCIEVINERCKDFLNINLEKGQGTLTLLHPFNSDFLILCELLVFINSMKKITYTVVINDKIEKEENKRITQLLEPIQGHVKVAHLQGPTWTDETINQRFKSFVNLEVVKFTECSEITLEAFNWRANSIAIEKCPKVSYTTFIKCKFNNMLFTYDDLKLLGKVQELDSYDKVHTLLTLLKSQDLKDKALLTMREEFIPKLIHFSSHLIQSQILQRCLDWINTRFASNITFKNAEEVVLSSISEELTVYLKDLISFLSPINLTINKSACAGPSFKILFTLLAQKIKSLSLIEVCTVPCKCTLVKEIIIRNASLDSSDIQNLNTQCQQLKHLHLINCQVTDAAAAEIALHYKSLKTLYVDQCSLKDKGYKELSGCKDAISNFRVTVTQKAYSNLSRDQFIALLIELSKEQGQGMVDYLVKHFDEGEPFSLEQIFKINRYACLHNHADLLEKCKHVINTLLAEFIIIDLASNKATINLVAAHPFWDKHRNTVQTILVDLFNYKKLNYTLNLGVGFTNEMNNPEEIDNFLAPLATSISTAILKGTFSNPDRLFLRVKILKQMTHLTIEDGSQLADNNLTKLKSLCKGLKTLVLINSQNISYTELILCGYSDSRDISIIYEKVAVRTLGDSAGIKEPKLHLILLQTLFQHEKIHLINAYFDSLTLELLPTILENALTSKNELLIRACFNWMNGQFNSIEIPNLEHVIFFPNPSICKYPLSSLQPILHLIGRHASTLNVVCNAKAFEHPNEMKPLMEVLASKTTALTLICREDVRDETIFTPWIQNCRSLKKLSISNHSFRHSIANICEGIQELQFIQCPMAEINFRERRWENLTTLSLADNIHITYDYFEVIGPYLPNLKALDVTGCKNLKNDSLKHFGIIFTKLETLNLTGCELITFEKAEYTLYHLKSLILNQNKKIPVIHLRTFFAQCVRLEQLSLAHCTQVTDDYLRELGGRNEQFALQNASILLDAPLKQVDLTGCPVSENGIEELLAGFRNIQIVKAEGLPSVPKSLQKLLIENDRSQLKIVNGEDLTETSVRIIYRFYSASQSLHLINCTPKLALWAVSWLPTLRNLTLSYLDFSKEDEASVIKKLLSNISDLHELSLKNDEFHHLDDAWLETLSDKRNRRSLEKIKITGRTRISREKLESFRKLCADVAIEILPLPPPS